MIPKIIKYDNPCYKKDGCWTTSHYQNCVVCDTHLEHQSVKYNYMVIKGTDRYEVCVKCMNLPITKIIDAGIKRNTDRHERLKPLMVKFHEIMKKSMLKHNNRKSS